MTERLPIPPTKSALLALARDLHFLQQGEQMLEKKRDLLLRLVHERLRQYRLLRKEAAQQLRQAYHWLGIVQMRMGGQMLRQAAVGLKPAVALRIVARSSVGVEYPSVYAQALPLQPVGLMWTDASFDAARLQLRALTVTLARLGEAEAALWRLLAASRKTQKRVNALKYNIIPRYRTTLDFIHQALDEEERNTGYQVRVLRIAQGWPPSPRPLHNDGRAPSD
ncbi:MAG: V-type ATP synthase subunit D [Thiobacillaceae bacterium]|nr:V-type ATP synthase subunit D [Thiobacillaceae bacterium]MDW8324209.1 V-type ATP synthase subunit D [Burkholderiales bacterium]